MAEIIETHINGASNNNSIEGSDDGCDIAFDDPVVKIIRGFPNVTDDTIRKIKYKHFQCYLFNCRSNHFIIISETVTSCTRTYQHCLKKIWNCLALKMQKQGVK